MTYVPVAIIVGLVFVVVFIVMRKESGQRTETIYCYANKISFDEELGSDSFGTKLYPHPDDVYGVAGAGIVQVAVQLKRVVEETNFDVMESFSPSEVKAKLKKRDDDPDWIIYQRLRDKFDSEWRFHKDTDPLAPF